VIRTALRTHDLSCVITFFRILARAWDLECVGDGCGQVRRGCRSGACEDIALCLCEEGHAWGCDAVAEHLTIGAHVGSGSLFHSFLVLAYIVRKATLAIQSKRGKPSDSDNQHCNTQPLSTTDSAPSRTTSANSVIP
jgi:hypothetical protein